MKKILFLLAVFCLTQAVTVQADTDLAAYSNVIYVAPATVNPNVDGNETTLSICMNNKAEIRGFQFDLYLPEGMTAVKSSKGKFAVSLNKARLAEDDEHTLTVAEQSDGAIRFLCGSQYDETFTGSSGEIATIKVNIADLTASEYPITLKAIKLSETDITHFYEVPEVVTSFTVSSSAGPDESSTDYTAYSNVIYVAPANIDPTEAGSETTLSICMNNTAEIRGFQFDLYLPEGMTAVKTSKGKYIVSLNAARLPEDDEHTLTVAEQSDGAIRFLCGSQYDETFTGTSGEIATIKVNIEGLTAGKYPITLKAIKLSETNISNSYKVAEIVTTFTAFAAKADITMITDPAAVEGLVYTGEAQTLISTGVASFGDVLYSLDGKTYSKALPTATEAGTYTVYYRVEGDDNHNDFAAQTVSVTIATNKNALNSAISEAEAYYDTVMDISPDAAAALQAAINAAKTVQSNADATQQEIETATTNLEEAIEEAAAPLEWQMAEGWNWVSHNRKNALEPKALFSKNMVEMKSQTQGIIRDSKYELVGNLTELLPTAAYKVRATADDTEPCEIAGELFSIKNTPIELKKGWNWIGCPLYQAAEIAVALKNLEPEEDDCIVGQEGFATYAEGGWRGDLTTLTPGRGYMYKSGKDNSFHFNASAEAKMRLVSNSKEMAEMAEEESIWTCNRHQYPNMMPVIAALKNDHTEIDMEHYSVAAFCDDECRGVGKVVNGRVMMNVCGEGGEAITFKALDKKTGIIIDINADVVFTDDMLGTYTSPYQLQIDEETTSIISIDHGQWTMDNEAGAWYDMQGRNLQGKPTSKGIYINGDRKVLIK